MNVIVVISALLLGFLVGVAICAAAFVEVLKSGGKTSNLCRVGGRWQWIERTSVIDGDR